MGQALRSSVTKLGFLFQQLDCWAEAVEFFMWAKKMATSERFLTASELAPAVYSDNGKLPSTTLSLQIAHAVVQRSKKLNENSPPHCDDCAAAGWFLLYNK